MSLSRFPSLVLVVSAAVLLPSALAAQSIGFGPRLSFVRGDVPSATASTRFLGGILRMQASKRVVFEAAADFRSERTGDGLTRVTERPLQGSLLLFPVRSTIAPYVLAGYGLYTRSVETLDLAGTPVVIASDRRTGAHVGLGAELFLGRHAALLIDYRYRFVRFGVAEAGEDQVNLPGLGDRVSHRGSMWTSGVAFYF